MLTNPIIIGLRQGFQGEAKGMRAAIDQWIPMMAQWKEHGADGDFTLELAAMDEEETTAALFVRLERLLRERADMIHEFRRLLLGSYVAECQKREGAQNGQ